MVYCEHLLVWLDASEISTFPTRRNGDLMG